MAKPKKNVIGEIYGRLVIIGDAPYKAKDRRVFVRCECGNEKDVLLGDLRRGDTVSCGCFLKEKITRHGDSTSRIYKIYKGMINRCYLPTTTNFNLYGSRGITVCDAWRSSFECFREWAFSHGYTDDLTIDRINVDGNYEPDNCQWLTMHMQQRNRQAVKGSSSSYIGVSLCKQTGKWIAMIKVNGKQKNLGRFATEIEAAIARDQYIVDMGLEHFHMNGVL